MSARWPEIQALRRARPRNQLARALYFCFAVLLLSPWFFYSFEFAQLLSERRLSNAARFIGEIVPYPIQQQGVSIELGLQWFARLWSEKGFAALQISFAISVLSILLAAALSVVGSMLCSRRLRYAEQLEFRQSKSVTARLTLIASRILALFARAIPEYLWCFILVMLLGVSAWPAILALAIHNAGILSKLGSEAMDDLPEAPFRALRGIGATPLKLGLFVALPMFITRFLLFFFVRWETCVRESTVLGFLGIVSLGYWVEDARARNFYDEMMFFILLGCILVFMGDILSSMTRWYIRRSG